MKVQIDPDQCSVQPLICKPIKECQSKAILYSEDENAILGAKMEVDEAICDGCGICIPICCGNAISFKIRSE